MSKQKDMLDAIKKSQEIEETNSNVASLNVDNLDIGVEVTVGQQEDISQKWDATAEEVGLYELKRVEREIAKYIMLKSLADEQMESVISAISLLELCEVEDSGLVKIFKSQNSHIDFRIDEWGIGDD